MTINNAFRLELFGAIPEDPDALVRDVQELRKQLKETRYTRFAGSPVERENGEAYRELLKARLKATRRRQKELCSKCLGTGESEDQHFVYKECDKCLRLNPAFYKR
jgi:hypothetical protein